MRGWQREKRAAMVAARLSVILAVVMVSSFTINAWLTPALIGGWFIVPLILIGLGNLVGRACAEWATRFVLTGQPRTDKRSDD